MFSPVCPINPVWTVGDVNVCLSTESFGVPVQVCNRSFKMRPFSRSLVHYDWDVVLQQITRMWEAFQTTRFVVFVALTGHDCTHRNPCWFSQVWILHLSQSFMLLPFLMCLFIKYSWQFDYTCRCKGVK